MQMSKIKYALLTAITTFALTGCHSIRQARCPTGEMVAEGKICPCHDARTDPQGCGEAIYNARHVSKLQIGQTMKKARELLGREPEQRSVRSEGSRTIETWGFLTNYQNTIYSAITFHDGKLVAIETQQR